MTSLQVTKMDISCNFVREILNKLLKRDRLAVICVHIAVGELKYLSAVLLLSPKAVSKRLVHPQSLDVFDLQ